MDLDALLLSRLQFAFTIAFHIIFPSFTIGLASFLAVLEGLWLATGKEAFKRLYLFWIKVFALSFGMGVVSGVVMSYELGSNWSTFSLAAAPVIGPLLAFEVLTAFFLESSFLGVMLFGWRKVGRGLHFLATLLVAVGTLVSAFWIISANSWMQAPSGYVVTPGGALMARDWMAVIFSPTFPSRLVHVVLGAYLTTALVVAAGSAWRLLKAPDEVESRISLRMAIGMFAIVAPLQLVAGHISGERVREHQPLKTAAIEALWQTRADQPQHLVGLPDRATASTRWDISVPGIGNWMQGLPRSAVIRGLDAWPRADWPVVWLVYWAFRAMVGLGLAMIGLVVWGVWLWAKGRLEASAWFLRAAVAMGPAGFAAVICGWIVAEAGRQPFVIYGLLRTSDAVSPVAAGPVSISLAGFILVYAIVFSAGALYILRLLAIGPTWDAEEADLVQRAPGTALALRPDPEGRA